MLLYTDTETFSAVDIKTAGTVKYAKSADMILGGFKLGDQYDYYDYSCKPTIPQFALEHIHNGGMVVAHNALFDYIVLSKYIPFLKIEQMIDSMAVVAAHGLPLSLEKSGAALGLDIQKYSGGSRLVRKFCIPRVATKNNYLLRIHAQDAKDEWLEFRDVYLKADIDAMEQIIIKLGVLSPEEQQYWVDTQVVNLAGIPIDVDTVKHILSNLNELVDAESSSFIRLAGHFPTQRNVTLGWVRQHGVKVLDLQADTVSAIIEDPKTPDLVRTALEHRANTSHMSFKKFPVMLDALDEEDNRVKGTLLYHASHTGRFGGRLLQPQNLTKGSIDGIEAVERIHNGEFTVELVKSSVRPMIYSPKGFTIVDYAGIEARIVQWLVGDELALQVFRDGLDPYKWMAMKIYHVPYDEVTDKQRFTGKQAVLGLGYSMSAKKFKQTVEGYGEEISMSEAVKVVEVYRSTHRLLVSFWRSINTGAVMAMDRLGKTIRVNKYITFLFTGSFLEMGLPSGRSIKYPFPNMEIGDYGPSVSYQGTNENNQFVRVRTYGGKLTENAVQAISRDLLVHAVRNLLDKGYVITTHIHDEIVVEGTYPVKEISDIMCDLPEWAAGAPITATGFNSPRFIKK